MGDFTSSNNQCAVVRSVVSSNNCSLAEAKTISELRSVAQQWNEITYSSI